MSVHKRHQAFAQGSVSFETTGRSGGDAGHGGCTEVTLNTEGGSTVLEVDIATEDGWLTHRCVNYVTLRFLGDDELNAAIEYFGWLAERLKIVRDLTF